MNRLLGTGLTIVVAGALLALFVFGLAKQGDNRSLDSAVARGARPAAPDRRLPLLGATGSRALASYRGHVLVLNFWASWCVPCAAEAPLLEQAQRKLAGGGGTVFGVAFRDVVPDALGFERKYGLTYPSVRDVDGKLASAYGTNALPETFILDAKSHIVALSRGQINQRFLVSAIAKAQRG